MRKLILLWIVITTLVSCTNNKITPIEKYGGSKYVIVDKHPAFTEGWEIRLKNPDTIFIIEVLTFDAEKYDIGDTIR